MDLKLIRDAEHWKKIEREIENRGGVNKVEVVNAPEQFPVIMCYILSFNVNGLQAIVRHNTVREVQELIDTVTADD